MMILHKILKIREVAAYFCIGIYSNIFCINLIYFLQTDSKKQEVQHSFENYFCGVHTTF